MTGEEKPRTSRKWVMEPTPQGGASLQQSHFSANTVLPSGVILNASHPLGEDPGRHTTLHPGPRSTGCLSVPRPTELLCPEPRAPEPVLPRKRTRPHATGAPAKGEAGCGGGAEGRPVRVGDDTGVEGGSPDGPADRVQPKKRGQKAALADGVRHQVPLALLKWRQGCRDGRPGAHVPQPPTPPHASHPSKEEPLRASSVYLSLPRAQARSF